jgi:SAM-dependent methyltransferase
MAAIVRKNVASAATGAALVTGFSADWLALREPADTRARDVNLTTRLVQAARQTPRSRGASAPSAGAGTVRPRLRVIDLACGTGANLRYLAPRIGAEQQWQLVDSDSALLEKVATVAGCDVKTQRLDLTTDLSALDFAPDTIVTASALLDLVSERWLTRLVECCRAGRCAALFALSYDGRIELSPRDPDDEWLRQLVNRHQLGDKGFGPALGPDAWRRTRDLFREAGYTGLTARSDWNLLPEETLLQQALLEGWAGAAMELASGEGSRGREWLARRLAHVAIGASRITVGHEDVLALPPDRG